MNFARKLSAWCLLVGTVIGFAVASWQGHLAAGYSKPSHFRRFHQRLSPDAYFYPTYAMLETLALARWQPGKQLVIIGGNSVLNGVGQTEDELWSQQLQHLLGHDYVVVNLSLRGGSPAEGAALVAESLHARGYPVIYVANMLPDNLLLSPEGVYGYLYWQGWYAGKVPAYAPRTEAIATWLSRLPPSARDDQREKQLSGWLEARFHAQSLWLHIGYRHFFTVHAGLVADRPWIARDQLPDNEQPARPLAERFVASIDREMVNVRNASATMAVKTSDGQWEVPTEKKAALRASIESSFSPEFRPRILMLLNHAGRYYLDHLDGDERLRDDLVYREFAQVWREAGATCVETGGNAFEPIDNIDHVHLSGSGGTKLARLVADAIRREGNFPKP